MHRKRKLQLARQEKREYVTSENKQRRKTKASASHMRVSAAARVLRNNARRKRHKRPPGYHGPIVVTTNMARAAEESPKLSHVKFTAELRAARKEGNARQYRNVFEDWRQGWRERFGSIAERTSYERRRGR